MGNGASAAFNELDALRAEVERLKNVEERYRLAAMATSDAIWDWDLVRNRLAWNENIYTLFGYTAGEDIDNIQWWYDRIHPDEKEEVIESIHRVINTASHYWSAEYRFRKKDGSYADIIDRGYILLDDKGRSTRMVGAMQDITERKKSRKVEKFLHEATETLHSSLDYELTIVRTVQLCVPTLSDIAYIDLMDENDTVRRLTFANADPLKNKLAEHSLNFPPSKMNMQYPPAQALFEGKYTLIPKLNDDIINGFAQTEKHACIIRAANPKSLITVPISIKGEHIGALTLVTAESGRIYTEKDLNIATDLAKGVAIAIDNARLYKSQAESMEQLELLTLALKASEERFRRMQEGSVDGFVQLESIRDEQGKIVNFIWKHHNKAAEQLIPMIKERIKYLRALDMFPGLKKSGVFDELVKVIETDTTVMREVHYLYDDVNKWIRYIAVKIDNGVVVSFTDITEAKLLDEEKDKFIGMASHELKTPLTSILGYLQLLEQAETVALNRSYVNKIITQVQRLQKLISELLDISRIRAGKLDLQLSEFMIGDLVNDCIESMRINRKHRIVLEGDKGNWYVKADRARMEQVMINLLSNAIKYSPGSDTVIVRIEKKDHEALISVQDFGIGIPRSEFAKIFERFHRVNSEKKFQGLGLGLYIANDIIQRHKGKMWVESEQGKGTTFYFTLPLQ